jgi:phosphopentomutase
MPRAVIIVLDGAGVGEMPDAARYGDEGSNTLGNLSRAVGGLVLPTLERMGLGNIIDIEGIAREEKPVASWGRMAELSAGKDTITGHWEMTGIVNERPFPTYPNGFPPEIIEQFELKIGREVNNQGVGRRARQNRKSHRLHLGGQRISDSRTRRGNKRE